MDKYDAIDRAIELLKFYDERGIVLNSKLKDTDCKVENREEKVLLFFKFNVKDYLISLDYANQVVNRNTVKNYEKYLNNYIEYHSQKEHGFLFLTYTVEVNEDKLAAAKLLKDNCKAISNVYENKLDTLEFDKSVEKFATLLKEKVPTRPIGDYGVIYSYVIEEMPIFEATTNKQLNDMLVKNVSLVEQAKQADEGLTLNK